MEDTLYLYPGATDEQAYEWLNRCTDPHQRLERWWGSIAPIDGAMLLDVGAGSGFHAVRYAACAAHVFALEPDGRLLQQIYARLAQHPYDNISVLAAGAASIPLPDACVDVVYARFAYFFGTEACLPGLAEVRRVLRAGGHFFIIDADPDHGDYGALARQAYPDTFHEHYTRDNAAFYASQGFTAHRVDTVFRAPNRDVLRTVFRMDFPHTYETLLAQVEDMTLDYTMSVYYWVKAE